MLFPIYPSVPGYLLLSCRNKVFISGVVTDGDSSFDLDRASCTATHISLDSDWVSEGAGDTGSFLLRASKLDDVSSLLLR